MTAASTKLTVSQPLPAGCNLLTTSAIRRLAVGAPIALANRRIVCVSGPTGCGKTVALDVLANVLADAGKRVVTVLLHRRLSDRQVIAHIYKAIHGIDGDLPASTRRDEIMTHLRHDLAGSNIVIQLDEAQNASLGALELLRMLHEHPTAGCGLVVAGVNLDRKLAADPMLNNRIALRVRVEPLAGATLTASLAELHPLLGSYEPHLLEAADRELCHGQLRLWTMLLEWLHAYGASVDDDPATARDTLAKALDWLLGAPIELP